MSGRWWRLGACALCYALGAGCLALAGFLVHSAIRLSDPVARFSLLAGGAVLVGSALYLFVAVPSAIMSRAEDTKFVEYLARRAARDGLPTDPAVYADGGLAVAATAGRLEEAELAASVLRSADIPAWVEGAAAASWFWHMQFGLHPAGIRVMVPAGRLADARRVLTQERRETFGREGPALEEADDPAYHLYRRARGLAYLLLIGLLAPVVFVLSVRLLRQIGRERARLGQSLYLGRAHRLALVTAIISFPIWGVLAGVVGILTVQVTRSLL